MQFFPALQYNYNNESNKLPSLHVFAQIHLTFSRSQPDSSSSSGAYEQRRALYRLNRWQMSMQASANKSHKYLVNRSECAVAWLYVCVCVHPPFSQKHRHTFEQRLPNMNNTATKNINISPALGNNSIYFILFRKLLVLAFFSCCLCFLTAESVVSLLQLGCYKYYNSYRALVVPWARRITALLSVVMISPCCVCVGCGGEGGVIKELVNSLSVFSWK